MRENRIDCIISTFLFKQKLNTIAKPTNRLSFSPRFSSFILLYLSVSSLLPPGRGSHSPAQRKGLHRKSRGLFEGPLVVSCKTRAGVVGEDLARERERGEGGMAGAAAEVVANEGRRMEGWLYLIRSNRFGLQYSRKRYFVLEENCLHCFKAVPSSKKEVVILEIQCVVFAFNLEVNFLFTFKLEVGN